MIAVYKLMLDSSKLLFLVQAFRHSHTYTSMDKFSFLRRFYHFMNTFELNKRDFINTLETAAVWTIFAFFRKK